MTIHSQPQPHNEPQARTAGFRGTNRAFAQYLTTLPKRPTERNRTRLALALNEVSANLWRVVETLSVRYADCHPFTDADLAALQAACAALDHVAQHQASAARAARERKIESPTYLNTQEQNSCG